MGTSRLGGAKTSRYHVRRMLKTCACEPTVSQMVQPSLSPLVEKMTRTKLGSGEGCSSNHGTRRTFVSRPSPSGAEAMLPTHVWSAHLDMDRHGATASAHG